MLEVENINTYYGKSHVLQDITFKVEDGEILTILGRNGVGKTTTIRSIMGLTPPKSGKILLGGRNIMGLPANIIARLGIGYVPQGRHLFPELTVSENLRIGYMVKRQDEEVEKRVLDLFPVLNERVDQMAGTLSGGEQQMLAIARALNTNPSLILMDEPTEGLMPTMVSKTAENIKTINKSGVSILLVEQKVKVALEISDRIIILEKGAIKHEGPPKEIAENEEMLLKYLGVKA